MEINLITLTLGRHTLTVSENLARRIVDDLQAQIADQTAIADTDPCEHHWVTEILGDRGSQYAADCCLICGEERKIEDLPCELNHG